MRASVGLLIEGRLTKESVSGQTGGGPSVRAVVVVGVLPVGYLPLPGKGKEKISEIRYPGDSEYLRASVRYVEAVGPRTLKPSLFVIDLPLASKYGVLTSSLLTLFLFLR